ncbi:MAG: TadE/TadG family type IV pilus assembly protein [Tessaracoccus sp.]
MTRNSRGLAASIEAAILLPVLVLFVGLLVISARIALAQQALTAVASQAARVASLERNVGEGQREASAAVRTGLAEHDLECVSSQIDVDVAGLAAPLGSAAEVRVAVRCSVSFADVSLPFMPGSHQLEAEAVSPVDRFRQR